MGEKKNQKKHRIFWLGLFFFLLHCYDLMNSVSFDIKDLTDLEDLSEVCVSVGEHGIDAVDGILGLTRRASLSFGL